MHRCCLYVLLLLSALIPLVPCEAAADSWPQPQTKEVFSESREYFVRVIPGESLGDTIGFAGARKGDMQRPNSIVVAMIAHTAS